MPAKFESTPSGGAAGFAGASQTIHMSDEEEADTVDADANPEATSQPQVPSCRSHEGSEGFWNYHQLITHLF